MFYQGCDNTVPGHGCMAGMSPYDVAGLVAVVLGLVVYRSKAEPDTRGKGAGGGATDEELYFSPAGV